MSFKLVAQVFDIRVGNPLRKMVLIKLADQANDNGYCWPSYETLAWSCEISRRSVINHIKWLADNGFLWIEKRYDHEAQKSLSNIYHLTLSKGKQVTDNDSAGAAPLKTTLVQDMHYPSAGAAPDLVQDMHYPSAGAAPKPIIESINKPIIESLLKKEKKMISLDFSATQEQVKIMDKYQLDDKMCLRAFIKEKTDSQELSECWTTSFSKWIDNLISELEPSKLPPESIELPPLANPPVEASKPAEASKPPATTYQPQPDVYHPSHSTSNEPSQPMPYADPNWHWKEPLPNMSIPETEKYIKQNKRKGENNNKAYQRFYAEMVEAL